MVRTSPLDALVDDPAREPPGNRELYYRWEREQWRSGPLDLAGDRPAWIEDLTDADRRAVAWALVPFHHADIPADLLVPLVDAAPNEEQQVFLTTQLADEARHAVFFGRCAAEIWSEREGAIHPAMEHLLLDRFPDLTAALAPAPGGEDALIELVVLYHLIVIGGLRLPAARFVLERLGTDPSLPAFRAGLTAVARDHRRHAAFGVGFLRDAVTAYPRRGAVEACVARCLPVALTVFDGSPEGAELVDHARSSVAARLGVIGCEGAVPS